MKRGVYKLQKFPKSKLSFLVIIITFIISLFPTYYLAANRRVLNPNEDLSNVINYVSSAEFMANVKRHVSFFSDLGSRVTGREGSFEAAKYIADKFEEYGLKPGGDEGYYEYFNVTVPLENDVRVVIPDIGVTIKSYALWPNGIQACYTPPEGLRGKLIYFRNGSLEEISSILKRYKIEDLDNVIALMDFNTQKNWLNLVSFGVKAIIFLEPDDSNRIEAETKFTLTPLLIPRLYILKNDSNILLKNVGKEVIVYSDMKYENVKAVNVVGIIKGTEYKNDVIVVSSYYDSWSVIPSLSPGADQATGTAVLLELARYFSLNKPKRTIWFVAFSGHWQALRGSRYFVEKHYFAPEVQNDTVKVWVHFNLDLSTDSSTVSWVHYGSMWNQDKVAGLFDYIFSFIEGHVYHFLEEAGFNVSRYVDSCKMPQMQKYFIHDAEPSVIAGIAGFSFITSRSMRLNWETPFETIDKVVFENLTPQAIFASACVQMIANVDNLGLEWGIDNVKPVRRYMRSGGGYPGRKGYAGIYGDIVRFDPETRWYTSQGLENYDVVLDVVLSPSRYNPFAHTIVKLDGNSSLKFRVEGIGTDYIFPETGYGAHYVGAGEPGVPAIRIYAYAVNKTTGEIEWAPDLGIWAWPQNRGLTTDRPDGWKDVRISLFKCETVVLTDIIDPPRFEEPWINVNWRLSTFSRFGRTSDMPTRHELTIEFEVMDFTTHSPFIQWGLLTPQETGEPIALIFLRENSTFEVILRAPDGVKGVLTNADEKNLEGKGFDIRCEENRRISLPIQVANDLYRLNEKRFGIVANYRSYSFWALSTYENSQKYYKLMIDSCRNKEFSLALGYALLTWNWSIKTYHELFNLINGLTYTFIFFSSLLIPFAFLVERLLIQSEGLKRIFWIIGVYAISFAILSFSHPGFEVAISTPLAVMAFVQAVMSIITFTLLGGVTGGYLKEVRSKVRGLHFAEISRSSAVMFAASLGIQQIRRRRLRAALTIFTVSTISFSLVLLTSVTGGMSVKSAATLEGATYDGALVNSNLGIEYVGSKVAYAVKSLLENKTSTIVERAWVYPPPFSNFASSTSAVRQFWILRSGEKTTQIYAILGLEPEEASLTNLDKILVDGRFFARNEIYSCIVGKSLADKLDLKYGSTVDVCGVTLKVVGILDNQLFTSIKDIDGSPLSPVDFGQIRIMMAGSPLTPEMLKMMALGYRVASEYLLIVPHKLATEIFGARDYSIVVQAPQEKLKGVGQELPLIQYALTVFIGNREQGLTNLFSSSILIISMGWESVAFPVIIASLMILNIMLGTIYERIRELKTLASLGLSPLHIFGLLLIEAILYGVIGIVCGYIPGIIGCRILLSLGRVPQGFVPGFASSYILLVSGTIMLMLLVATSYPASKASTLVTPSILRKFRFRAGKIEETLQVQLPFVATDEDVYALLSYIAEYIDACKVEGVGPFITLEECKFAREVSGFTKRLTLETRLHLPPYDANITQTLRVVASGELGVNRYTFTIIMNRLTGSPDVWTKSVGSLVEELRTQFLLWRTLSSDDRAKYIKIGEGIRETLEGEEEE